MTAALKLLRQIRSRADAPGKPAARSEDSPIELINSEWWATMAFARGRFREQVGEPSSETLECAARLEMVARGQHERRGLSVSNARELLSALYDGRMAGQFQGRWMVLRPRYEQGTAATSRPTQIPACSTRCLGVKS